MRFGSVDEAEEGVRSGGYGRGDRSEGGRNGFGRSGDGGLISRCTLSHLVDVYSTEIAERILHPEMTSSRRLLHSRRCSATERQLPSRSRSCVHEGGDGRSGERRLRMHLRGLSGKFVSFSQSTTEEEQDEGDESDDGDN